jgi:predicted ATP-binding protein involved in virulence
VLSTVPKESIRLLTQNTLAESIAAIPLAHSYGEPSNTILQAIMHVDPQPPIREKEQLDQLTSLVDQGQYEVPEVDSLFQQLNQTLSKEHPQLVKIKRSIHRQKMLSEMSCKR